MELVENLIFISISLLWRLYFFLFLLQFVPENVGFHVLRVAGIQPTAPQVDPGSAVWVFLGWRESLRPVTPEVWGKSLGVSASTTVIFSVAVDCAGVSYLGPCFRLPTFWADDFGNIVTTELATHPFRDVFKQVSGDQFRAGILGKLSCASTSGLFIHNHLL